MKLFYLWWGLLMFCSAALALDAINPPGLLPTEIARPLLEQDPGVAAARAGLEVALREADLLDGSPYEWTARSGTQRREIASGAQYGVWSVGLERTIRLPGKALADRHLGGATIDASEAAYGEALHESARHLLALWLDWQATEHTSVLTAEHLLAVEDNLAAVEKRVRAGDAATLDASVAKAEMAEQKRLHNDALTQASAAWARLSTRFPGINRQIVKLPSVVSIDDDVESLRERILAQSDEIKVVESALKLSQFHAARADAERIPDPTVGVSAAWELAGREKVAGISLSIPIPGSARSHNRERALAATQVWLQDLELKKREINAEIAALVASARGAHESVRLAQEGAQSARDNARLMQRAYLLGEAELQTLLLTRRLQTTAESAVLTAQVTALKAYFGLLLDAHLIWDLAHD